MMNSVLHVQRGGASARRTRQDDRQPKSQSKRQPHLGRSLQNKKSRAMRLLAAVHLMQNFTFFTFFYPTRGGRNM
jgi:hypothetical protein